MDLQGMKILVFSPMELPFTVGARYSGLERLAVQFARYLSKDHDVTLLAHKDTDFPYGVHKLKCEGYTINREIHAEQRAFQKYQEVFYDYDVIFDIGHLHLIARFMPSLKTVNVLNHAPEHAQYPKAPYNIVSWSKWGVGQFRKYYRQNARYQETIIVDPEVYYPKGKRGDRLLTIGRMSPEKGNLNAIMLCKKFGLPLDVVGGRGSEIVGGDAIRDYEKAIMDLCDDKEIIFHGEVSDEEKIELMRSCRALIYITNHTEITSHKVQEAMFCGAPVIIPNSGGLPEIVTNGIDGYLCGSEAEYILALDNLDKLDPTKTHDAVVNKYCPETVIDGYAGLFEQVIGGLRW